MTCTVGGITYTISSLFPISNWKTEVQSGFRWRSPKSHKVKPVFEVGLCGDSYPSPFPSHYFGWWNGGWEESLDVWALVMSYQPHPWRQMKLLQEQRPVVSPGRNDMLLAKLFLQAEVENTCVAGNRDSFHSNTGVAFYFFSIFRK